MQIDVKLLFICFVIVATASPCLCHEAKQDQVPGSALKNSILPSVQTLPNKGEDGDMSNAGCRDISLHKCGSSMVRVFRLLDFLASKKKALEAKCTLRKAFFTCMKAENHPCKKRRRRSDDRFRKKIVRSLWSTRECIIGMERT